MYKAYFDRRKGSIDGLFTIHKIDGLEVTEIFKHLPVRSGQRGFENVNWTSGKAPIPYTRELGGKVLRIHIAKPRQEGQWANGAGIGEFWPIYNVPGDIRLIRGDDPDEVRVDIGGHPENAFKGSAGCVVFVCDTFSQKKELVRLSRFLKSLIGVCEYIELEVL